MVERPLETLAVAVAAIAVLLGALGVAVHVFEQRSDAAGETAQSGPVPRPARHRHLNAQELARLSAFRARARLMAGEPLAAPGWRGQLRHAWREGYGGWIIACLAGSFSMATHFGAWWLISGGGWLGAIVVTLVSTIVMVWTCAWIGLGLLNGR